MNIRPTIAWLNRHFSSSAEEEISLELHRAFDRPPPCTRHSCEKQDISWRQIKEDGFQKLSGRKKPTDCGHAAVMTLKLGVLMFRERNRDVRSESWKSEFEVCVPWPGCEPMEIPVGYK